MNLVFHPSIEDDLADAALFYENRLLGLGEDFLAEVRRGIDEILSAPERWQRVETGPVRRYLLERFPYSVLYHVSHYRILILVVTHTKKHPDAWKTRLRAING